MTISIEGPQEPPVPPEAVRIRSLSVDPYGDGRRVRLSLDLTPFDTSPNLEIQVQNQAGEPVSSAAVIGVHQPRLSLTLHLRGPAGPGAYHLQASLSYEEHGIVDQAEATFEIRSQGER